MKIYVASSLRNQHQPEVVKALRDAKHEVYDFRHPSPGAVDAKTKKEALGFQWEEISKGWKNWKPRSYVTALDHPAARRGFDRDMNALRESYLTVLVLPSGTSSHLEAGWAKGNGDGLIIYYDNDYYFPMDSQPELMYKMADDIVFGLEELLPIVRGYALAKEG